MATKLFKRTNDKDVFEQIVEHDDPPAVEDTQACTDPVDVDTSEVAANDAGDAVIHIAPPSRRKRWLSYTLTAVTILIVIAALGSSGYFGWQYKQQRDIDSASLAALSSAERFAVTLTSIDTNGVDQNFAHVIDGSTGEFKDMYSQSASQLRQVLIDNKAMSKGTIIDSAVKSRSKTKVDVVLFVDQWITNVASPQPRLDRSRVAMTMELVDGRWLASTVELK
jgi:Mce-associated membrane protein